MKDGTAKNAFCLQERAREKTGEMLTNTLIPLENRNSSTHGSQCPKTPTGKWEDVSLREKEKEIQKDLDDRIDPIGKNDRL